MRAVVSYADTPHYQQKMKRLQESVESQGVKFIGYTSPSQVGCKPHSVVPYQFKPYAIWKAIEQGVRTILWCDSCIYAIKDLQPVFEYIEEFDFMFFNNVDHPLGKWTNDKMLNHFGISREDAWGIKQTMACCQGFNVNSAFVVENLLKPYRDLSDELYPGSSLNHRHDQSLISCLIYKNGLPILTAHETFFIYEDFKKVPQFTINYDTVCLVSK